MEPTSSTQKKILEGHKPRKTAIPFATEVATDPPYGRSWSGPGSGKRGESKHRDSWVSNYAAMKKTKEVAIHNLLLLLTTVSAVVISVLANSHSRGSSDFFRGGVDPSIGSIDWRGFLEPTSDGARGSAVAAPTGIIAFLPPRTLVLEAPNEDDSLEVVAAAAGQLSKWYLRFFGLAWDVPEWFPMAFRSSSAFCLGMVVLILGAFFTSRSGYRYVFGAPLFFCVRLYLIGEQIS